MISPTAIIATIKLNVLRRPLLRVTTVQDCLAKSRDEVNAMIDSGELAWAFDLSATPGPRKEPRIFALCVAEQAGWTSPAGQTKNFQIPEVIGLILPKRDVRSTELERLFACSHQHIRRLAKNFNVIRKPKVADGPDSYTVFHRASVETFLTQRRMA